MVKLHLALERRCYFPYDIVKGRLTLKTKKTTAVGALEIRLCKVQRLEIAEGGASGRVVAMGDEAGGCYEHGFTVAADKEIRAGEHIFPFRFNVKGGEGATTSMSGMFNDLHCRIENTYTIVGRCVFDGERVETTRLELVVHNRSNEIQFVDTKIKVSTFMCLFSTVYLYRIVTDRSFYNTGDTINIRFFPTSLIKKNMISGIKVSLYEIFVYENEASKIVRSRLLFDTKAVETEKNRYQASFRLPFGLCGTFSDDRLTVRATLFFSIHFYRGPPLKLKKYIDVGRPRITIPEIEEHFVFDGTCYNEKLLEF